MNSAIVRYMFDQFYDSFRCYQNANSGAEYGIHPDEFVAMDDWEIEKEALEKWAEMSVQQRTEIVISVKARLIQSKKTIESQITELDNIDVSK